MKESENRKSIKKIFTKKYLKSDLEFINQHGNIYSVVGIPDLLVLTPDGNYWFEIKRDWKDKPRTVQKWWIERLRLYGFITGFVVVSEYKESWEDEHPRSLEGLIIEHFEFDNPKRLNDVVKENFKI
jgi:hypothetical protein